MGKSYDVGHGRPPKHTRFRKGQSGNPKGRPKGTRNRKSIVREIMERRVTVRENGISRTVTVADAAIEKLIAKSLNGTVNDLVKTIQLFAKYVPEKFEDEKDVAPSVINVHFLESDGNGRPKEPVEK